MIANAQAEVCRLEEPSSVGRISCAHARFHSMSRSPSTTSPPKLPFTVWTGIVLSRFSAEAGEGRAQTKENIVQSHMRPTQSRKRPRDCPLWASIRRHSSRVTAVWVDALVLICTGAIIENPIPYCHASSQLMSVICNTDDGLDETFDYRQPAIACPVVTRPSRYLVCPLARRKNCTGFCTDCLHPALTGGYWPFSGGSLEVIEVKGKSCSISNL